MLEASKAVKWHLTPIARWSLLNTSSYKESGCGEGGRLGNRISHIRQLSLAGAFVLQSASFLLALLPPIPFIDLLDTFLSFSYLNQQGVI